LLYCLAERPGIASLTSAAKARIPSLALAVALACLVIWAGYRFSFHKIPAPELFAGIETVKAHNASGHPGYLLGRRSSSGFWYFYPVAIAVKTPLGFLALLAFGLVLTRKERGLWIPLAFAAGILAVGAASRINIGLRHVLPVYTAFAIAAAVGARRMLAGPRWAAALAFVLTLWFGASSLASHPDYLAYFNELAGSEPEKILVDSDLDWGQDLKRAAARLRQSGATEVAYLPTIVVEPEKQLGFPPVKGMDVQRPSPGWNLVGVTVWKELRMALGDKYPEAVLWPDRVPPLERVGKGMLLYYFP
jgi:hypothetical protein